MKRYFISTHAFRGEVKNVNRGGIQTNEYPPQTQSIPILLQLSISTPSFSVQKSISSHLPHTDNERTTPNIQIIEQKCLIVKDPTVIPPGCLLLFCSQLGDVEDLTNFFGRFSHELTRNFETGDVKERL